MKRRRGVQAEPLVTRVVGASERGEEDADEGRRRHWREALEGQEASAIMSFIAANMNGKRAI